MYKHNKKIKEESHILITLLFSIVVATMCYFAWIACTIQADPIVRAYELFNHATLYEDGSFTAQRHDGTVYNGCVKGGLCQD